MVRLWRGYHSSNLRPLLDRAYNESPHGEILILCSPLVEDFGFLLALKDKEVEFFGDWPSDLKQKAQKTAEAVEPGPIDFPQKPLVGVFTSGTESGKPRLILYSKENIQASLKGIRSFFDRGKIKKVFCYPQPFHVFGLVLGYLHGLEHGIEIITVDGPYSKSFHKVWFDSVDQGTLTLGTPTHFFDLVQWCLKENRKPSSSYSAIIGGAPVSVGLWKSLVTVTQIESPSIGYGASEATPGISHLGPGTEPEEDGEVGEIIPKVQVQMRPEGLEFDGPNRCMALIENNKVVIPQTILIKDHLVPGKREGHFIFAGRLDLMVNRGGAKYSLEQMENILESQLSLSNVCVPVDCKRLGKDVGILVAGRSFEKSHIQSVIKKSFGFRVREDLILNVPDLPKSSSSKLDRKKSSALFHEKLGDIR